MRYCIVCGCELESRHQNAKYCDGCRDVKKRMESKRRREEEKAKKRLQNLDQLAREAREAGMSYGKYIASRGIV